jgi:hypothetical protein
MARSYKRDKKGRFASTGGGGKLGKSEKNEKARAKYKAAATPKASAPKTRRQPSSPRGLDGPQRRTSASTVAKADANARLSEGRRLKGKGNNPTARAERNLERAMAGKGRKARKSEATAARAIDYMAKTGKLGKRSNGTKKRRG